MPEKSTAHCPVGLEDVRTGNGPVLVHLPEKFYYPVSLVTWGVPVPISITDARYTLASGALYLFIYLFIYLLCVFLDFGAHSSPF